MRTAALLSVLMLLLAGSAFGQDWTEYINRDDGFRVDFPGQPRVENITWTSEYGYTLPARVYSADRGRERYSITVVDYRGVESMGLARAKACPAGAEPCSGGQAGPAGAGGPPAAAPAAAQAAPPALPVLPEGPRTVVTYVEVVPASERQAAALMSKYRDAARRETGNARADVFQQNGRPGHFMVVEEWRDDGSWKAHRGSPQVTAFHQALTPLRVSPYDERGHVGLATAPATSSSPGAVLVVTHIDVTGAGAPKTRELLRTLADASRKESGNIRFDALQAVRPNHFTVVEMWRDEPAREAHLAQGHTKAFRDGLYQFAVEGAPYDERLYRMLTP